MRRPVYRMPNLFTPEFFDELVNRLNSDPDFQKKASSLNIKTLMTGRGLPPDNAQRTFLLRIEKGKATWENATLETPCDFSFLGDHAAWMSNHKGEGSLEKMIMSGKIKFKGNMAKILMIRPQLTIVDNVSQKVPADL